jgi:serine/threonine-protein kinase
VPGYEVLEPLGRGGMGVVYKARHVKLNRIVALKMILSGEHADLEDRRRFETEARSAARLQHPNIVQVFETGEHNGLPFFALEYCPGGSLARRLATGPLEPKAAAALLEKLARALGSAHQAQIVHRDLNPGNVLLTEAGEPKVTDFGLAKRLDEAARTQSGAVMGTPSYMAPEQASSSKLVGPVADVYALGATLYECLTGRPPFRAAAAMDTLLQVLSEEPVPVRRLQPKVPRDLETICHKCLEKDPRKRYPTAEDLATDLLRFQSDQPIQARPIGVAERAWRWCRRNRALAVVATIAILSLVVGTVVSAWLAVWALNNAKAARDNQRWAEARTQEVQAEQEKVRSALAAEARRRRQARQALGSLSDDVVQELLARRGELDPGQKAFLEKALRLQEEFAQDLGDDAESLLEAADSELCIANIQHRLARLPEAEKAFRAALVLYERLEKANPDNTRSRSRQATAWNNLGNLLREMVRPQEADDALQRARRLTEKLGGPPADTRLAGLRARMNQALNQELNGNLLQAIAEYRAVLAELVAAEAQPSATEAELSLLASCRSNLGSALNTAGLNKEAVEHLKNSVAGFRLLCGHFPHNASHRSGLCKAVHNFGSAREALRDLAGAERLFAEAVQEEKKLVEEYPGVPEYRADLANHLDRLATRVRLSGRKKEAEPLYREAATAASRAAKDRPHADELRQQEANVYENLATLLAELDRFSEAEPSMRESLGAWRVLGRDHPGNPYYALRGAHAQLNLVHMLLDQTKDREALTEGDALVRELEKIARDQPSEGRLRPLLAKALQIRAEASLRLRHYREALTDCERSLGMPECAGRPPLLLTQASCLAALDHPAKAAASLDQLLKEGEVPSKFFLDMARIYARASSVAKDDKDRAEQCARQAVDLLRQAYQAGELRSPANREVLRDTALDVLRKRPDFKAFLEKMSKP